MGSDTLIDTKKCSKCREYKTVSEFALDLASGCGRQRKCRECERRRVYRNADRMWVNGRHVPKSHPLHKPGRYRTFEAAAFASLQNYSKCPSGEVYIITNVAWPEWVKVGKAIDANDRSNGYQTSSPYRDYRLEWKITVTDRTVAEAAAHAALAKITERNNEWFRIGADMAAAVIKGDPIVQSLVK
jgi:hypothetical protein